MANLKFIDPANGLAGGVNSCRQDLTDFLTVQPDQAKK
jgi:hypothetical protein